MQSLVYESLIRSFPLIDFLLKQYISYMQPAELYLTLQDEAMQESYSCAK